MLTGGVAHTQLCLCRSCRMIDQVLQDNVGWTQSRPDGTDQLLLTLDGMTGEPLGRKIRLGWLCATVQPACRGSGLGIEPGRFLLRVLEALHQIAYGFCLG